MIKQFLEKFCQLLRILVGTLVAVLLIPVAMQVIARYTGLLPVYLWTEELATFIFIWIVMLGSMIAVWEGTHFDVHVIPDATTPLGTFLQKGIVLVLVSMFALLFAWYGIGYAQFGSIQQSVMMQVNLIVIYASVPIAGAGWALFSFYRLYEAFAEYRSASEATA